MWITADAMAGERLQFLPVGLPSGVPAFGVGPPEEVSSVAGLPVFVARTKRTGHSAVRLDEKIGQYLSIG